MLIANLAITDLILTTVSTPLYLVDITLKYWPLGVDMVRAEFDNLSSVFIILIKNDLLKVKREFLYFLECEIDL